MLSIVRNMGSTVCGLAASQAALRMGAQAAAAMSSRSWVVRDNTPIWSPSVALSKREVAVPSKPMESVAEGTQAKPALEARLKLKDGRDVVVRRAEAGDEKALVAFFMDLGAGAGSPAHAGQLCQTGADEVLWMAGAPRHDAFVAVVGGRIVGTAGFDPDTHELAPPKNRSFLYGQGIDPGKVCVGSLSVLHEMQGLGIGTALKKLQTTSAAHAGYLGVTSDTHSEPLKAIVRKLGGTVQEGGVSAWTLVRTGAKDVKGE